MRLRICALALKTFQRAVLLGLLALVAPAQTVTIDATPSHVANTFSPLQALGTTLDRIPSNTTDIFFRPDQIKQILEAGWGPVTVSPEYGTIRSSVALESRRQMERPFRQGLFHWGCNPDHRK